MSAPSADQDEDRPVEASATADDTESGKAPSGRDALEAAVKKGEGVEKIWRNSFEPLFDRPDAIVETCESLAICFKDQPEWLADLVRPAHLVKELSHGSTHVTALVLGYWARAGETHKLARLADHLLEAAPRLKTPVGGRMMTLLASSLGVLRPRRSADLLATATPLLAEAGADKELLDDARQWVNAGHLLQSVDLDERTFWNQRLRMPESTWDWQSDQAQQAVVKLRGLLHPESIAAPLFLAALPSTVRRFFEPDASEPQPSRASTGKKVSERADAKKRDDPNSGQTPVPDASEKSASDKPQPSAADPADHTTPASHSKQESDAADAPAKASIAKTETLPPAEEEPVLESSSTPPAPADEEPESAPASSSDEGPSRSRSTFPAWLGGAMVGALAVAGCWCWQPRWIDPVRKQLAEHGVMNLPSEDTNTAAIPLPIVPPATPSAAASTPAAPVPLLASPPAAKAATPTKQVDATRLFPAWRQEAIQQLERDHPAVSRWHAMIKAGPLEDNMPLLLGRRSFLPASHPDYPVLLKWLMLDPPAEPEARSAVARLIINRADQKEVVPLLDKLAYAGSPNASEVEEACKLLLDLPKRRWTAEERSTLETIAKGQLKAAPVAPAKP